MKSKVKLVLSFTIYMSSMQYLILSGAIISPGDKKVHKTTIVADKSSKNIVVFWTSENVKNFKSRVSLVFNSSKDGGKSWLKTPKIFIGNAKSSWINDFLPMLRFDKVGLLHMVWLQTDNRTAPRYSMTRDLGKSWTPPVIIGKVKSISRSGVAMGIDYSRDIMELNPFLADESEDKPSEPVKRIWSMYDDYRLHGMMVETSKKKWYSVPVRVSRTRNLPGKVKYALQYGTERYILRLQKRSSLCLLRCKNRKWSTHLIFQSQKPIDMAARHSFVVDSKGAIYFVFCEQAKLHCLYMERFGSKVRKVDLPKLDGNIKAPVVAISKRGVVCIACQVDNVNTENNSRIAYISSRSGSKLWSKFKFLKKSGSKQSFPDMVMVDDRILISYTEAKQAAFTTVSAARK